MRRLRKHITFILIGIFIFPLLFGFVHVIEHHSHEHKHIHHKCDEHSHSHSHEDNGNKLNAFKNIENEHCLICEYQFSLNAYSKVLIIQQAIPIVKLDKIQLTNSLFCQQVASNKSPRAPPCV